jgi:hypothetical protein
MNPAAEAGRMRPFSAIPQPPERASLAPESAKADFAPLLQRVHLPAPARPTFFIVIPAVPKSRRAKSEAGGSPARGAARFVIQ